MTKSEVYRFPPSAVKHIRRAALAALAMERKSIPGGVSFIMVSDPEIRKMNRRFRNVDRITDVISFRFPSGDEGVAGVPVSGDIYIARGRSKKQAAEQGHSWRDELVYLAIHGVLHILGYTDYDPAEKKKMFAHQDKIFAELK